MEYRRLGRSGVKVSQLSLGSWITFGKQLQIKDVVNALAVAKEHGCNFFDNAEVYAQGQSETLMGEALKQLKWPRLSYLVSTKFFWGISNDPNGTNTLNRKYLLDAMHGSLKRFGLDYIDLIYCHRPDPNTPIEETVHAMHDLIDRGHALYWGTSEWSADEIRAAWDIADRNHWHKPVVEQPQYNLLHRRRVEVEYARLYEDIGLGLTTWSPLASGLLTGKYLKSVPSDSRAGVANLSWLQKDIQDPRRKEAVTQFVELANQLGCKPAQLALAWSTSHPFVSTTITGASRPEQIIENFKSLDVLPKLTAEVKDKLNLIFPIE